MSEAEQARKRREKILRNASSRMESVGGAFGGESTKSTATPDPLESQRNYEQRVYESFRQRVEGSWIVILLSCAILYGWKYHFALWPSPQGLTPPVYLPSPGLLFSAGLIVKYLILNMKLPVAPPSVFDQIFQTIGASLPFGNSQIIGALLGLHTRAKLLGDVVGDICLGIFTVQITMLILYLVFEL